MAGWRQPPVFCAEGNDMQEPLIVKGTGFSFDCSKGTRIMGILNVTPDSFYDGGWYKNIDTAVSHGTKMAEEGADIFDIGGESTRPGADIVNVDEELQRVIPVIEKLCKLIQQPISIDTRRAKVAREALHAGARIVNDVSGLTADSEMVEVVASSKVPVVIMHTLGNPRIMQENPSYIDTIREVKDWLTKRILYAVENGIKRSQIIIDPGIGFGKRLIDNLLLIRFLASFKKLGCPILIGPSRKSFIGNLLDLNEDDRLEGTAGAVALSVANGANIVRVHDVNKMRSVIRIADAICGVQQENTSNINPEK